MYLKAVLFTKLRESREVTLCCSYLMYVTPVGKCCFGRTAVCYPYLCHETVAADLNKWGS